MTHRWLLSVALAALLASAWCRPTSVGAQAACSVDPVQRVLSAALPDLRDCATHLPPHSHIRLALTVVIAPSGQVTDTGIDERARGFRGCLRRVALALVFPADPTGEERRVDFPLRVDTHERIPRSR